MKNKPTNLDPDNPMVQMHLSNYWEYSPCDEEDDMGSGILRLYLL